MTIFQVSTKIWKLLPNYPQTFHKYFHVTLTYNRPQIPRNSHSIKLQIARSPTTIRQFIWSTIVNDGRRSFCKTVRAPAYPRSYYLHLTRTEPFWSDFRRHFPAIHQSSTGLVETFLSKERSVRNVEIERARWNEGTRNGTRHMRILHTAVFGKGKRNDSCDRCKGLQLSADETRWYFYRIFSFNFLNLKTKTYSEHGALGIRR